MTTLNDRLRLEYIPLDVAMLWDDNQKRHDIGGLIQSFQQYGFKDPPKFEPHLNDGRGAFVEGNGRTEALDAMRRDDMPPPRGIAVSDEGAWLVPVVFGVDADSEAAASAYGIDHNSLTLTGGDFTLRDIMRLYDTGIEEQLIALAEQQVIPVSADANDIDSLLDDIGYEVPPPVDPPDPTLEYEHVIEIGCSQADLEEFMDTLNLWMERESVTINIS